MKNKRPRIQSTPVAERTYELVSSYRHKSQSTNERMAYNNKKADNDFRRSLRHAMREDIARGR